jgi:hypothetical protein
MHKTQANCPPHSHPSAESDLCRAIAALGRLAGIDVERGDGPDDIDGNLIQAAYECHFDDPEFLGGPGCLAQAGTSGEVALLTNKARLVTRGLLRYIEKRAPLETLRVAQAQAALVEQAFAGLQGPH